MSSLPNASDSTGVSAAFALLAPGLQRQLWAMEWRALRPLQVEGIRAILQSEQHVILAAPTASGKTEAAFLPILSKIVDEPVGSVRALYVGPLKALINDQFSRVNDLCGYMEMPVYHWHGDVAAAQKKHLLDKPGGVLLITPESIESLFVNKPTYLSKLFAGLRFVVIDELHAFLETARGLHLRSLLSRLRDHVEQPARLRFVGLSATIGDFEIAKQYMDRESPERVTLIEDHSEAKELKLRIHTYETAAPSAEESSDDDEDPITEDTRRLATDLVRHCRGTANLVFANARGRVEELADLCQEIGRDQQLPDRFLVHHGSLSAEIRQDAEQTLKSGSVATAFCTSTLEMGIDIGSVKMVCQVGVPWSVASLKQRLGRSGRKSNEPQILRMYVTCDSLTSKSDLFDRLQLELVQAVAMTELLLEKWVEPPKLPTWDLSTLTHQILSVIGQTGGIRANRLFDCLVARGVFKEIDAPTFTKLLRQLATKKIIEQMSEGDLILGLTGEALLRRRDFYAVFPTPDEYAVVYQSTTLGSLETDPKPGQHLIFAGKRWLVDTVDQERRVIVVVPARGRKRTVFSGSGGFLDAIICQKMKQILLDDKQYTYLDLTGQKILQMARQTARLSGVCSNSVVSLGPQSCAIMTWQGTLMGHTLAGMFEQFGLKPEQKEIGLVLNCSADAVPGVVQKCLSHSIDESKLADTFLYKIPERKYDWTLDENLRRLSLEHAYLDLKTARTVLQNLQISTCSTMESKPIVEPKFVVQLKKVQQRLPTCVVLDFETANAQRDSACAIGLVKIVDGQIVEQLQYLIRPPTPNFSSINIGIHGITWEKVADAPTFAELWPKLQTVFQSAQYLVAHNAPFDRHVLTTCCLRYGLPLPTQRFLCTVQISKRIWPMLPSHNLKTVCQHLGIVLQHHDAESDAQASAKILLEAICRGYRIE